MKNKVFLLICGLIIFASCRGSRPALIPEVGPPISQEDVSAYRGGLAGDMTLPCATGIGWVDTAGKI